MKTSLTLLILLFTFSSFAKSLVFGCYMNSTPTIAENVSNHREFVVGERYDFSDYTDGEVATYLYSGEFPNHKISVSHTMGNDYATVELLNTNDNTMITSHLILGRSSAEKDAILRIDVSSNDHVTVRCGLSENN